MRAARCACVCMWSTFHKIKDDIDSVTRRERAVGNDSCPFNRCPEDASTSTYVLTHRSTFRRTLIKNIIVLSASTFDTEHLQLFQVVKFETGKYIKFPSVINELRVPH